MDMYGYNFYTERDLAHYGLKGMHWGTRRWQNEDGTFNAAGKERYFGRGTGEDYHPVSSKAKAVSDSVKRGASKVEDAADSVKKAAEKVRTTTEKAEKTITDVHDKITSFDKEKAKKIAKNVAIGTAIVGGTVLAVYGAKKLKDAGVLETIKEGRAANAKRFEDMKTDIAQIHAQAKEKHAQIMSDMKSDLKKIGENGKLNLAAINIDPTERLNAATLKKEISINKDHTSLKKFIRSLTDDEVASINSGKSTFNDIRKARREANGNWSEFNPSQIPYYEKYKDYFGNVSDVIKTVTVGQTGTSSTKTVSAGKKTVEQITKAVGSKQIGSVYEKTVNATKSAASKTTNYVKSGQAKKDAQTVARSAKKAASTAADVAKAAPQVISESKKVVASVRNERIIREYKKQHPNTKLSDAEIIENYG